MNVCRIIVKVNRNEIFYITGLFESYSRIASTRTVDRFEALLEINASPYFVDDVHALIEALKKEILIQIVQEPVHTL